MDKLVINELKINTRIGIHPWEQRILQLLLLTISIDYDFTTCNDNIQNTLDYDLLCKKVTHYIETNQFNLIETVAEEVAKLIKTQFQVDTITIIVNKPHAIKNANGVSVTLVR